MDSITNKGRNILISTFTNEGLYLLSVYLLRGILFVDPLKWHMEGLTYLYTYLICPWGGFLIGMRLFRIKVNQTKPGKEMPLLFLLFAWISFPMLFRFGVTFNNAVTDIGYIIVFFGLYASVSEREQPERRRIFLETGILFMGLSFIWGGLLLYCACTGTIIGEETGGVIFGVQNGILYAGVHYNSVGMMATGCLFLSYALFEAGSILSVRIAGLIGTVIMVLVIILSQSRSTRYAMLIAFSFGLFIRVLAGSRGNKLIRGLCAVLCAAVTLVGGFIAASMITDAALAHYEKLTNESAAAGATVSKSGNPDRMDSMDDPVFPGTEWLVLSANAEEGMTGKARVAVDSTFSDRTNVWHNLFDLWQSDIKKFLIGRGVGNTGSLIAHDTSHEIDGTAAVHNTYLQFIADFGLIGFILQIVFFIAVFPDAWRGFMSGVRGDAPGLLAMGMMIVDILAVGMMESAPLGQMTPMNLMLYTALAYLVAEGKGIAVHAHGG